MKLLNASGNLKMALHKEELGHGLKLGVSSLNGPFEGLIKEFELGKVSLASFQSLSKSLGLLSSLYFDTSIFLAKRPSFPQRNMRINFLLSRLASFFNDALILSALLAASKSSSLTLGY